ncbi:MAG: hypothetical protein RDU14_06290 [Melioribacteraceae bacterium]|nr:hypothetical protein [Melioribacteraceae bacterium]
MNSKINYDTKVFGKFLVYEINILRNLKSPSGIQHFLNGTDYNPDYITCSPRKIIKSRKANCFEGALFAAAALRVMGHKPVIVDLMADNDDDHVIAIFKQNNCYGAIAKSNTTLLRFREPVYRTIRELVMSYFDFYFNTLGEKSLRSYSVPVDLSRFDKQYWMTTDEDLEFIGDYLFTIKHYPILTKQMIKQLSIADKEVVNLCFTGSVLEGLFKPKRKNEIINPKSY